MRRFFQSDLKAGMPISTRGFARGVDLMAKALERMEMIGGHVEWSAHNVPRLIVNKAASSSSGYPQAWDIAINDATVTLSNCCYMRGPIFKLIGKLETTLSEGSDKDAIWLSVEIDAITGSAELKTGTMEDCTDQAAPEPTSTKLRIPLYVLAQSTNAETGVVTFSVTTDLRTCATAMLYV
jgi:hypothetical protein